MVWKSPGDCAVGPESGECFVTIKSSGCVPLHRSPLRRSVFSFSMLNQRHRSLHIFPFPQSDTISSGPKGRSFPQPGPEVFRRPWNRSLNSLKGLKGRPSLLLNLIIYKLKAIEWTALQASRDFSSKCSQGLRQTSDRWLGELLAPLGRKTKIGSRSTERNSDDLPISMKMYHNQ